MCANGNRDGSECMRYSRSFQSHDFRKKTVFESPTTFILEILKGNYSSIHIILAVSTPSVSSKCLIPLPTKSGEIVYYCGFEKNDFCGGQVGAGSTVV